MCFYPRKNGEHNPFLGKLLFQFNLTIPKYPDPSKA